MPQVSAREFERLPLRVHEFLNGVPCTTFGPLICRTRTPESRSMSSYARQRIVPSLRL
jgi:hypothetical protein